MISWPIWQLACSLVGIGWKLLLGTLALETAMFLEEALDRYINARGSAAGKLTGLGSVG